MTIKTPQAGLKTRLVVLIGLKDMNLRTLRFVFFFFVQATNNFLFRQKNFANYSDGTEIQNLNNSVETPYLKNNSVLVMGNVLLQCKAVPTTSYRGKSMNWFEAKGINFPEDGLKSQLLHL